MVVVRCALCPQVLLGECGAPTSFLLPRLHCVKVWLGSPSALVRAEIDPRGELAAHAKAIAGTVGLAGSWKADLVKSFGALRIKGQTSLA
eukprot:3960099-Amphidinium_carterae.1